MESKNYHYYFSFVKTLEKDFVTANYIIRPPAECPEAIRNSEGIKTMDVFLHYLSEDTEHTILIEGEW